MQTWKIIAILGAANLVTGLILVAIGLAFDLLGKVPGQIVTAGVALIGVPWLALAKHMQMSLAEDAKRRAAETRIIEAEAAERAAAAEHRAHSLRTGRYLAVETFERAAIARDGGQER